MILNRSISEQCDSICWWRGELCSCRRKYPSWYCCIVSTSQLIFRIIESPVSPSRHHPPDLQHWSFLDGEHWDNHPDHIATCIRMLVSGSYNVCGPAVNSSKVSSSALGTICIQLAVFRCLHVTRNENIIK